MKLYLSSYRIPTPATFFGLLDTRPASSRIALIPNAKDYLAELAWSVKTNETMDYFQSLGVTELDVVDLRQYRDKTKLKQALGNHNAIWIMGGNTFNLRLEMELSGFDAIIRDIVDTGVVYAGESAGALVAGNSLKGVELADNPKFAPKQIYSGLNLIDKFILPHTDNAMYAESNAEVRKMYENNPDYIELTDSQALVVNGSEIKIDEGNVSG